MVGIAAATSGIGGQIGAWAVTWACADADTRRQTKSPEMTVFMMNQGGAHQGKGRIHASPEGCRATRKTSVGPRRTVKRELPATRYRLLPTTDHRLPTRESLFDVWKSGEDDVADDLEAAGADELDGVVGRVPGGVLEVDDVDRGNAGAHERHVVIIDRRQLVREGRAVAEPRGRVPDDVDQPGRRVRIALDDQILVADHVEQDQRL